ncbi:MAG: hypothetical protein UY50_C0023G0045 [Parcubacteria group bacterium GW2011_GWA2_49_9]|nr:MAG: hypothetical protein UY50_C0023G0045 [Parcubacteria group bacterium GW2011_GWA2_49_9]
MRFDKEKAFELRRAGKSYKAIKAELGMSLATLSDWFRNEEWSKDIKSRLSSESSTKNSYKLDLMRRARRKQLDLLYERAQKEAFEEYQTHQNNPVFIAGLMIYWGEGDKLSKYRSGIANTEPLMIKVFLRFLLEICRIQKEKIRIWLLLYPDLDELLCKKYWMQYTGLQDDNFFQSIRIEGKSRVRRLNYGVCNVSISNRYFKEKMLIWLTLASKHFANSEAGIV